jgi:hypothetical protein
MHLTPNIIGLDVWIIWSIVTSFPGQAENREPIRKYRIPVLLRIGYVQIRMEFVKTGVPRTRSKLVLK